MDKHGICICLSLLPPLRYFIQGKAVSPDYYFIAFFAWVGLQNLSKCSPSSLFVDPVFCELTCLLNFICKPNISPPGLLTLTFGHAQSGKKFEWLAIHLPRRGRARWSPTLDHLSRRVEQQTELTGGGGPGREAPTPGPGGWVWVPALSSVSGGPQSSHLTFSTSISLK